MVDERQRTSDPAIYAAGDCVQMKNLITGIGGPVPFGDGADSGGEARLFRLLRGQREGK